MSTLKLLSPAKINLHLSILGKRSDGYHDLFMLMEKISISDTLVLEKIPKGIEITNPLPGVPPEKDLTCRAAVALQKVAATFCHGVRITTTKNIPMGGGLGGGSGNAATVLKGLNQLWDLKLSKSDLIKIGKGLGADVPFFLEEGPCWVEGIGEKLKKISNLPKLYMILVHPGCSVETPWAYQEWDLRRLTEPIQGASLPAPEELKEIKGIEDILAILKNDFETVVLPKFPQIGETKRILKKLGAKKSLMSGSGASVFGIFENVEGRDRALKAFPQVEGWRIWPVNN